MIVDLQDYFYKILFPFAERNNGDSSRFVGRIVAEIQRTMLDEIYNSGVELQDNADLMDEAIEILIAHDREHERMTRLVEIKFVLRVTGVEGATIRSFFCSSISCAIKGVCAHSIDRMVSALGDLSVCKNLMFDPNGAMRRSEGYLYIQNLLLEKIS